MHIRWTPAAAGDLDAINEYLKSYRPLDRRATLRSLYEAARSLKRFPERGRMGRVEGTRELVLTPLPYLVVYRISGEIAHVLRIFHASQARPPVADPLK